MKTNAKKNARAGLRPTKRELDHVRRLTDRNDHTEARRYIADWLAVRWDDANGGNGFTKPGNPFRILAEAFARIEYEHKLIGYMTMDLLSLRIELTNGIRDLVSDGPYFDAWCDFLKAL